MSEPISMESIASRLTTNFVGRTIIYHDRVSSTMDAAKEEAGRGAPEGTAVIAGAQTAGRGRLKRAWLCPEGNIALSVILYPDLVQLPYVIMGSSLAGARTLERTAGVKTQIKWPNDVLINGKKVSGILIENNVRESGVMSIIGIGINVELDPDRFPDIASIATGVNREAGKPVSRNDLICALLIEIERTYLLMRSRPGTVYRTWQGRLGMLGQKVKVISGRTTLYGVAESVARDGSLLLRHPNGSTTIVVCGDVSLRQV